MGKYEPIERYLDSLSRDGEHRLAFAEIERIIAAPLPPSAKRHQAWWANQRGAGHVQAHSWLNARFHTKDLDLKAGRVTFAPVDLPREPTRFSRTRPLTIDEAKAGLALHFGVDRSAIDITIRA
jgi:hypothetical protein